MSELPKTPFSSDAPSRCRIVLRHPRQIGVGEAVGFEHLVDSNVGVSLAKNESRKLLEGRLRIECSGLFQLHKKGALGIPVQRGNVYDQLLRLVAVGDLFDGEARLQEGPIEHI